MSFRLNRRGLGTMPLDAEKKAGKAVALSAHNGLAGHEKLLICLLGALYLIVGVGYSLQVPPFEAPDETSHYSFVLRMARGGTLPDMRYEAQGPWSSEGGQAPLYYYTMGYLIRGLDLSDPGVINRPNPHANWGNPQYPGNKNYNLYSGQRLPLAGANLTLHVVRWLSVLLSLGAVLFTYATARLAFPGARRLAGLSALAVALIPQFAFISARVSNDGMVTLLSAATIYWLALLLKAPHARAIKWAQWAILGILIGLAALTKLQGLALLGAALLVMAWLAWRDRSPGRLACALPIVIAPLLAIAGWWYWRNHSLYHDWLGITVLVGSSGNPGALPDLRWLLAELNGERMSFWGLFGWFSILLPGWTYIVLDFITVIALAGLARAAWQRLARGRLPAGWDGEVLLLLLAWAGILFALFCYWATFTAEPQGRELDPGLCAIGPLLVAGLAVWLERLPSPRQAEILALLPAGLAACSLWALLVLLPGTYLAPSPVAAVPAGAHRLDLVFDGEIELLGIELPSTRYHPGESVPVTLYEQTARSAGSGLPGLRAASGPGRLRYRQRHDISRLGAQPDTAVEARRHLPRSLSRGRRGQLGHGLPSARTGLCRFHPVEEPRSCHRDDRRRRRGIAFCRLSRAGAGRDGIGPIPRFAPGRRNLWVMHPPGRLLLVGRIAAAGRRRPACDLAVGGHAAPRP